MLHIRTLGGLSVEHVERARTGAATQPRRLAVLALIARAGSRGITRDKVLALLWPDADEDSGRRALTQSLYALRKDLRSEDLFDGVQDLRLNRDAARCDLLEFEAALREGELTRAVELYAGPFLEGFRLVGAAEFERWTEEQAAEIARAHASALERLARGALEAGRADEAVGWWRKLASTDPLNARVAVGLMEALVAAGASGEAVRHSRIYAALMEQELDLAPDRGVIELADRIREQATQSLAATTSTLPTELPAAEPPAATDLPAAAERRAATELTAAAESIGSAAEAAAIQPARESESAIDDTEQQPAATSSEPPSARRPRRWHLVLAASVLLAVAVAASLPSLQQRTGARARPAATDGELAVLAVGRISDYTAADGAAALADMLATNLARSARLRVISTPRLYALLQSAEGDTDFGAAAAQAGANTLLEGSIFETATGLRLDLRRIELGTGSVIAAYVVEGEDLFALADRGTARLVADLGVGAPEGALADLTTSSLAAYRYYVDGLYQYYRGDRDVARSRFDSALAADSTFAMAAYYAALTPGLSREEAVRRLNRAVALADRATDRERLTIRAAYARLTASPSLGAIADTMAVRYPLSVEGHFYRGIFLGIRQGELAPAIEAFRRVLDMDSVATDVAFIDCVACHVYNELVAIYLHADSFAAAVRVSDEGRRRFPDHPTVWRASGRALGHAGRYDDAVQAFAMAARLASASESLAENEAWVRLLAQDYDRADALLREQLRVASTGDRQRARTLLVLSLRAQGRLTEALTEAQALGGAAARSVGSGANTRGAGVSPDAMLEALLLSELGRPGEATALYDSIARWEIAGQDPAVTAGARIMPLVQRATIAAQQGDTSRLDAMATEVARLAGMDGERHRRDLDQYTRGLLLMARGDLDGAEAALRKALYSPALGYTRINMTLAEIHLRQQRPRDAVAVLQPVVRGATGAWNSYVSRTEAHELLARAWEDAGQADSALHHYERAARAWRLAEPPLLARRDEALRRSQALRAR